MPSSLESVLAKISRLRTYRRGERRAPHKPLLLLIAIAALLKGTRNLSFVQIEKKLLPLLDAFAPPVVGRHQPQLPFWHLATDGLWEIPGKDQLPRQAGGFPVMSALRATVGHLPDDLATVVTTDPAGTELIVERLLNEFFPRTMHEDILAAVGIAPTIVSDVRDVDPARAPLRYRNPRFRDNVLRAYEHQCAATGFRAALGGSYFGCEAAHVKWHAYGGPDDVSNGIALAPTIHKLFDAGAWTLSDRRRIIVSKEFTGSDHAVTLVRSLHGQPLRNPLPGESPVSEEFIRWHREAALGGVFRTPGLPLED